MVWSDHINQIDLCFDFDTSIDWFDWFDFDQINEIDRSDQLQTLASMFERQSPKNEWMLLLLFSSELSPNASWPISLCYLSIFWRFLMLEELKNLFDNKKSTNNIKRVNDWWWWETRPYRPCASTLITTPAAIDRSLIDRLIRLIDHRFINSNWLIHDGYSITTRGLVRLLPAARIQAVPQHFRAAIWPIFGQKMHGRLAFAPGQPLAVGANVRRETRVFPATR